MDKKSVNLKVYLDFGCIGDFDLEYPNFSDIHEYISFCKKQRENFDMILVGNGRMILIPIKETVVFVIQKDLRTTVPTYEYKLLRGSSVFDLSDFRVLDKLNVFVEGDRCVDQGSEFYNTSVKFGTMDLGKGKFREKMKKTGWTEKMEKQFREDFNKEQDNMIMASSPFQKNLNLMSGILDNMRKMQAILDDLPDFISDELKKGLDNILLYGESRIDVNNLIKKYEEYKNGKDK